MTFLGQGEQFLFTVAPLINAPLHLLSKAFPVILPSSGLPEILATG